MIYHYSKGIEIEDRQQEIYQGEQRYINQILTIVYERGQFLIIGAALP